MEKYYTGSNKSKTANGEYSRVTIEMHGQDAAPLSKIAREWFVLEQSKKQIVEQHTTINDKIKSIVGNMFDGENDHKLTREIETKSYKIQMSKNVEQNETISTTFNLDDFIAELDETFDENVRDKIKKLIENNTKTEIKIRPEQLGRISIKQKESK